MEPFNVLIVDDEPDVRLMLRGLLCEFRITLPESGEPAGLVLGEADSAEAAIEKINLAAPDLILLDDLPPGKSGLHVLDHLAAHKLHSVPIMITAQPSLEFAITATKRGAHDILPKPFTPESLHAIIQKAAGRLDHARQVCALETERRQIRFEFLSVLAHELQAPLNAVEGYLEMMRGRALGGDLAAYGDVLARSLDRIEGMRKLIVDLLDLTRIESGQRRRELIPLDMVEAARRAIDGVAAEAARRRITISLDAPAPVPLIADRGEIEIIWNNLLSNAVKYNIEGGRVEVWVGAAAGVVRLAVHDTGIGLAPEDAARLFQDFVRIKSARTRGIPGSGLGLSIVKKLATLYQGKVAVASVPGEGSTFTVVLRPPRDSAS